VNWIDQLRPPFFANPVVHFFESMARSPVWISVWFVITTTVVVLDAGYCFSRWENIASLDTALDTKLTFVPLGYNFGISYSILCNL
jgi:hypothetical protein